MSIKPAFALPKKAAEAEARASQGVLKCLPFVKWGYCILDAWSRMACGKGSVGASACTSFPLKSSVDVFVRVTP